MSPSAPALTAAQLLATVHVGAQPAEVLTAALGGVAYSRLAVVADATVWRLHGPRLAPLLPPDALVTAIAPGEPNKTLATCQHVWDVWFHAQLDRHALVLALGGGMTTDLAAFAASCWKRGVRFVLMPTTLLAMVDATLGGKTGVDYHSGKNLIGTFTLPQAIAIATDLLATLDARELRSGLAELLKHALLADPAEWQRLTQQPPTPAEWPQAIRRSLAYKAAIVAADPTEQGPRALLNLGHTLGHAIESLLLGSPHALLHGEAVALGLALEAQLAVAHAGLPAAEAQAIAQALAALGFPARLPELPLEPLAALLRQDKKNRAADGPHTLRLPLLERIGRARYDVPVPLADALDVCQAAMSAPSTVFSL